MFVFWMFWMRPFDCVLRRRRQQSWNCAFIALVLHFLPSSVSPPENSLVKIWYSCCCRYIDFKTGKKKRKKKKWKRCCSFWRHSAPVFLFHFSCLLSFSWRPASSGLRTAWFGTFCWTKWKSYLTASSHTTKASFSFLAALYSCVKTEKEREREPQMSGEREEKPTSEYVRRELYSDELKPETEKVLLYCWLNAS